VSLHDLTLTEQRAALDRREVRAVELVEHYLDRIARYDALLGSFTTLTLDLARQEAVAADQALDAGDRKPLLGLPLGFKDLAPVAGVRTTFGSKAFEDLVAPVDGPVVGRLRAAGAVTVGMTHAPEFGPTCFTESAVVGRPAVTPYDTARYASGSSGGAAAAVAAGLLPAAHASDGAGSIRTPAAVTGLVGLKPTRGLLPGAGGFVQWGTEGFVTRTVADTRLLLSACTAPTPGALYPAPVPPSVARPLRIRVASDPGLWSVEPVVLEALAAVAAELRAQGHDVVEAPTAAMWDEALVDAMTVAVTTALSATVERSVPVDRRALLHPYSLWCHQRGADFSAVDLVVAQSRLGEAARKVLAEAAAFDVLLTPTSTTPAVPVGYFTAVDSGEDCGRRMLAWSAFTPWANLTGQPSIAVPSPVTADGVPIGVQLTASRHGDDELLLDLAEDLDRAIVYSSRHPDTW
jgi:amidase